MTKTSKNLAPLSMPGLIHTTVVSDMAARDLADGPVAMISIERAGEVIDALVYPEDVVALHGWLGRLLDKV